VQGRRVECIRMTKPIPPRQLLAFAYEHLNLTAIQWLAAAYFLVALPHILWMPWWVSGVLTMAVVWKIFNVRADPGVIPSGYVRHPITILAIGGMLMQFNTFAGRQAGISLLCLMLGLKFLEARSRRDGLFISALLFFLLATQGLVYQGLFSSIYAVALVFVLMALLRVMNQPAQRIGGDFGQTVGLFAGRSVWAALLRPLLFAIPLGILLFVLVPRFPTPVVGVPQGSDEARTGIDDRMRPGSVRNLYVDDSPAFRARFTDGQPPLPNEMYWRGPVLERYDGQEWAPSWYADKIPADIPTDDALAKLPRVSYEITIEPTDRRFLFGLDVPIRGPVGSEFTNDFQLKSKAPVINILRYSATSVPALFSAHASRNKKPVLSTMLPERAAPRTRALAKQMRAQVGSDREFVTHVLEYFRTEGFVYSLENVLLTGDPVDEFMFEEKRGYCENYSSSFVVIMRAAGIPARVVTGYLGAIYNADGDYYLVRQSDAHAWSEVWLEDAGWTRVDPTAMVSPDRINFGSDALDGSTSFWDAAWIRELRGRYDFVQAMWNEVLLGFNAARQSAVLDDIGIGSGDYLKLVLALVAGAALIGAGVLLFGRKRTEPDPDPSHLLYLDLVQRLAKSGIELPINCDPGQVLNAIGARIGEADRNALEAFLKRLLEARYNTESRVSASELSSLKQALDTLPKTFAASP
jgi:protein-glutamine gamma-glutamyltransferase